MLKYIQFILSRVGGAQELVTKCNQENVRLPLGTLFYLALVLARVKTTKLNFTNNSPLLTLYIIMEEK